jgi:hypothetical protein
LEETEHQEVGVALVHQKEEKKEKEEKKKMKRDLMDLSQHLVVDEMMKLQPELHYVLCYYRLVHFVACAMNTAGAALKGLRLETKHERREESMKT